MGQVGHMPARRTPSTRHHPRRRGGPWRWRAALVTWALAVAAGAVSGSSAVAATVTFGWEFDEEHGDEPHLRFSALPGERNRVRFTSSGNALVIQDAHRLRLVAKRDEHQARTPSCARISAFAVRCSSPRTFRFTSFELGDRDDRYVNQSPFDSVVAGGSGDDSLVGGSQGDSLAGQAGRDSIRGGSGDDSILGDCGHTRVATREWRDDIDGGSGADWAEFCQPGRLRVDLERGVGARDVMRGIENVVANDATRAVLIGDAKPNWLWVRGSGADRVLGRGGNDVLLGGAGDVLYGGDGDDRITVRSADAAFSGAAPVRAFGGDGEDVMGADEWTSGVLHGGRGDDAVESSIPSGSATVLSCGFVAEELTSPGEGLLWMRRDGVRRVGDAIQVALKWRGRKPKLVRARVHATSERGPVDVAEGHRELRRGQAAIVRMRFTASGREILAASPENTWLDVRAARGREWLGEWSFEPESIAAPFPVRAP